MSGKVIHSFHKNTQERVQASISTYKGREYADIRVHYQADDGEWRPTKKGITIALDLLPDLAEALKKLRKAARQTMTEGA
jgi:hypothetical protein